MSHKPNESAQIGFLESLFDVNGDGKVDEVDIDDDFFMFQMFWEETEDDEDDDDYYYDER